MSDARINETTDSIRISNAQLRYYMHIQDPDTLSDEEWAMRLQELKWIRDKESGK
ncbi:MAG: hypothetical protein JST21_06265 [Bacteroidetes bacterium]|nr:hypothetical protein [Bacteroidota bacterium]